MKAPYIGMRFFAEDWEFADDEEFAQLCDLIIESEMEAGRRAQMMDIGSGLVERVGGGLWLS